MGKEEGRGGGGCLSRLKTKEEERVRERLELLHGPGV